MADSIGAKSSLLSAILEAKADTNDEADGLLRETKENISKMASKATTW